MLWSCVLHDLKYFSSDPHDWFAKTTPSGNSLITGTDLNFYLKKINNNCATLLNLMFLIFKSLKVKQS